MRNFNKITIFYRRWRGFEKENYIHDEVFNDIRELLLL